MTNNNLSGINFDKIIENDYELQLYQDLAKEIIRYVENNKSSTFNEIIKEVGGSDRRILRLLDQLVNQKLITFKDYKFFSGRSEDIKIESKNFVCDSCCGKLVKIDGELGNITKIMKDIYQEKPKPTFLFDQRPVNFETTVRRVSYLIWRRDIQNKKIAILGDDDLTSLAIGLTGLAKEIVVFEIDKRLTKFIREKSEEFKLSITVIEQDLTKHIPQKYLNYFDIFMTDPTPTKIPFTVFANMGIAILKKNCGVGYLSYLPSCMSKTIDVQKIITDMNLLITDVIPFFTEYDFIKETYTPEDRKLLAKYSKEGSYISFFEHLIRVETTKETKILPISYIPEDLFGKATKRVLNNPEKDPAFSVKDPSIVKIVEEILKNKRAKK